MSLKPNNPLQEDAQTYAAFVGFAALHFTKKFSPVWALVSRALFFLRGYEGKKCLSIGPSDDLRKAGEVLQESESVEALKSKGIEYAESRGLENPE